MENQICKVCNKLKDLSEFRMSKSGKYTILRKECKECESLLTLKRYYLNIDKFKENRIKNKAEFNQNSKEHYYKIKNERKWLLHLKKAKERCNNINHKSYHRYGGRGITCLLSSQDIELLWFRDKAYELKQPSIDRKDNDGDYELDNCRFIEVIDNARKSDN